MSTLLESEQVKRVTGQDKKVRRIFYSNYHPSLTLTGIYVVELIQFNIEPFVKSTN